MDKLFINRGADQNNRQIRRSAACLPVKTVYTRLDRGRRILKEFVERRFGE